MGWTTAPSTAATGPDPGRAASNPVHSFANCPITFDFQSLRFSVCAADIPGKIQFASLNRDRHRGSVVQGIALQSGWETFLLAAPFVGMLLVGIFRLDAIAAAPRGKESPLRHRPGIDKQGRMVLTDPDGRPWTGAENSTLTD